MSPQKPVFDAVLAALKALRRTDRELHLGSIVAFLHVCGEEGVPITDLAHFYSFSESSTSRYVHALTRPSPSCGHGGLLKVVRPAVDARRRLVTLTDDGRRLRDEIAAILTH